MEKILRENTKYSRNETILKIGHLAKAIAHAKMVSLGQKLKMPKTCEKHNCTRTSSSVQKTAPKNTKYSRNETILEIGHLAKPIAPVKAIGLSKWSIWVKN